MSHADLLALLRRHRYLFTVAVFEGCPLIPAEAMLSGCCIVGFHGGGGLEYMRPGLNSEVVGYPRLDAAVDALAALARDPVRSAALAAVGRADAQALSLERFESAWRSFIDASITPAPSAAIGAAV
jgi:glycosyltransferase involved in cell wall biosynthesis